MSCSPELIKDYVLGELPAAERRRVAEHCVRCAACHEELSRLDFVGTALRSVAEEELPRRIAFVSDKVFEPAWWQRFWASGPRLGFASAAMLACAILVHGFVSKPAAPPAAAISAEVIAKAINVRVEAEVSRRLPEFVSKVVEQAAARSRTENEALIRQTASGIERKTEFQRRADLVTMEANYEQVQKQLKAIVRNIAYDRGPESGGAR